MKYFNILLALSVLVCCSCESDSEDTDSAPVITIVDFKTSKNEVEVIWDLKKGSQIIIEDLQIVRGSENQDFDYREANETTNIPSSSLSFIDTDVPYLDNLTYTIVVSYRLDSEDVLERKVAQSETVVFSRSFPKFEMAPFQVAQDSDQKQVYHILDIHRGARVLKYDGSSESITQEFEFTTDPGQNNRFHINGNAILSATKNGKITYLNKDSYQPMNTIQVNINDTFNAFAEQNGFIYYLDDEILHFYNINEDTQTNTGFVYQFDFLSDLDGTDFFALFSGISVSAVIKYQVQTTSFPGEEEYIQFEDVLNTYAMQTDGNDFDPNIFTWNNDRSLFLTSIEGRIYRTNDFSPVAVLQEQTGKNYFNFLIAENGDIYASVQGERLIHVFDGTSFELKDAITTKLYPLYPMLVNGEVQCIGAYEPVQYWNHIYGYEYIFNINCAVETFN